MTSLPSVTGVTRNPGGTRLRLSRQEVVVEDDPLPRFELNGLPDHCQSVVGLGTTVDQSKYYTDSNGLVAFAEPGLMDRKLFFHVKGHGYEFPKDGFGYRGKALLTKPGAQETLKVKRLNVAERLYRVTGGGIYRDTILLGRPAPIRQPLLNADVLGSDSVVTTIYEGRLYWFWGDTNRPGYPLGNFQVPGAWSRLPGIDTLDPEVGIDLKYEVDDQGFAKASAKMPGEGPTWIFGLVTIRTNDRIVGLDRVFAGYVKVRPPMEVYEHGLCEYDPATKAFVKRKVFAEGAPVYPDGQAFRVLAGAEPYYYFAQGYPYIRVRAEVDSFGDLGTYETFTPLKSGSRAEKLEVDRDSQGKVVWAWKRNAPPLRPVDQQSLVKSGKLASEDARLALRDAETGKSLLGHASTVEWNPHLNRWVMLICEQFGTSMLGELWFATARSPEGPWVYARKVVTHDNYSFYNPKQHPYFSKDDGRTIFFEGRHTLFRKIRCYKFSS